jgi:carboxylesterase
VRRLVLLATPKRLSNDWRIGLLPVARYVMPWFYPLQQANFADPRLRALMRQKDPTLDLDDPAVQQTLRTAVKIPVAAIDEAARAVRRAYAALPTITVPTLVMQGRDDETVPLSADEVYARLGTRDKQLIWWEQTGHQLLSSPQRNAIYTRIAEFLR